MESKTKKTKSKYQSCFILIVGLILILLVVGFVVFNTYNDAIYSANSSSTELVTFKVVDGDTLNSIAKTLEQQGLIKNSEILKIYLRLNNVDPKIKVGTYSIPKNKTALEIIKILEEGVLKPGIRVTLKEGLRHEQVASTVAIALGSSATFSESEFITIVENPDSYTFSSDVATFLTTYKPAGVRLEGFLYPDTYEFSQDQTTQEVIEKMIQNFIVKINDNLNLANLNLDQTEVTSLYQAMTLGSIIEKEAGKDEDRKDISSVFHNRLKENIPLQSDVTVNYVTGKNDDYVSLSDTETDSPYNTYKYAGLPPTPIDNPRIESILAALYPSTTDYFYFLYFDGVTYFSKTLEEHTQKACQFRGC